MDERTLTDPALVIRQWRNSVLNRLLAFVAAASFPALLAAIVNAQATNTMRWTVAVLALCESLLIALAIGRRLPAALRIGSLIVIGFVAAIANLLATGLAGSVPLYLLAIPVITLVLAGRRAGLAAAVFSGLLATVAAVLTTLGLIAHVPLVRSPWVGYSTTLMFLIIVMALLVMLYRLQERLIGDERKVQEQLRGAHALLEEQNLTLEQRVGERTAELERSTQVQSVLYEIADAASAVRDLDEFYRRIHPSISGLMYARNFLIALHDPDTGATSVPYFVDETEESPPGGSLETLPGTLGQVLRSGRPVGHRQDGMEPSCPAEDEPGVVDRIGAPLIVEGRLVGAIVLHSHTEGIRYTDEDGNVLAYVAQHIATALARARALEVERQRTNELAMLSSVAEAMSRTLDVRSVARIVGDHLREIFDTDSVLVLLLDRQTDLIHVLYAYDVSDGGHIELPRPFPLGKGLSSRVIASGRPLNYGTLQDAMAGGAHFLSPNGEGDSDVSTESWLGVPIIVQGAVLGLVVLADAERHAFGDNHVSLLSALSANIGIALENARLYEAERQRSSELAILSSVGEAMTRTLDVRSVSRIVGDRIRDIFDADSVMVMLLDAREEMIHVVYEYDRAVGGYHESIDPFPLGTGLSSRVILERRPLRYNTLEEELAAGAYFPPDHDGTTDSPRGQSWVGIPITVHDEVLGLVALADERPHAFGEGHLALLSALSANIGVAIHNARLYQAEQQRAAELATINRVTAAVSGELDLDALIREVGEQARALFDADIAYVALLDELGERIDFL